MYTCYREGYGGSNATVISDGYDNYYWNNGSSIRPSIAVDLHGKIHVVWQDDTDGIWAIDDEIMYVSYTEITGWSNVTIISDDDINWNTGGSNNPKIAVSDNGTVYIV